MMSNHLVIAGDVALSVPVEYCLFHKLRADDAGVHLKDGEMPTNEDKMKLAWASEMWITVELMKLLGKFAFSVDFIRIELILFLTLNKASSDFRLFGCQLN